MAAALGRDRITAIVDETVVEIGLDHEGPMPLPFGAHHADTISVGSASKSHWGGLRIGWIRAPRAPARRPSSPRACRSTSAHRSSTSSSSCTSCGAPPGITDERRRGLVEVTGRPGRGAADPVPELRFVAPRGGLSLWVELPEPVALEVTLAAEDEGLLFASGPRFAAAGGLDRWIRLPYVLTPEELVEAVERLARALARVADGRRSADGAVPIGHAGPSSPGVVRGGLTAGTSLG